TSERRGRECRQDGSAERQRTFEKNRKTSRDQTQMAARHRTKTLGRDVEGYQRRPAAILGDGARGGGWSGDRLVERGHAVGQVAAEAADMTNRKRLDMSAASVRH